MKIEKNKTEYTLYKGMGDVVVGQIIDYNNFKCSFIPIKDLYFGYELVDLIFICDEIKKLESKHKKSSGEKK